MEILHLSRIELKFIRAIKQIMTDIAFRILFFSGNIIMLQPYIPYILLAFGFFLSNYETFSDHFVNDNRIVLLTKILKLFLTNFIFSNHMDNKTTATANNDERMNIF